MIETNGNGKTYKQKLAEPILNPKQILIFILITIYEVISNVLPAIIGDEINWAWTIGNLSIGLVGYAATMMMRAAYPKEVPNMSMTNLFQEFIKNVISICLDNKADNSEKINGLERLIVWTVRELDTLYQEEYKNLTEYLQDKYKENGK